MIAIQNHLGEITLSKQFFASLIGGTVTRCFGVVDMNVGNLQQSIMESLKLGKKRNIEKGVMVRVSDEKISIDLHITVLYGVNVSAVVKSIQHKVRYVIESETDLTVNEVNVFVDNIKA